MFVIIVGGGQTGSQVASELLKGGHKVRIIEDRPSILARLKPEMPPDVVIEGDGSTPSVLEAAGIHEAQVLAAVTGQDETNLVVTTLGRFEFNVPRTIARVNNPKNGWMFMPDMGVDVALNQADLMAHLILEEMSLGDMTTLLKLRKGRFSLVEEKVHPTALANGKAIRDLPLPKECVFVAVIREAQLLIPNGDLILQPADEILALVHSSKVIELATLLNKTE